MRNPIDNIFPIRRIRVLIPIYLCFFASILYAQESKIVIGKTKDKFGLTVFSSIGANCEVDFRKIKYFDDSVFFIFNDTTCTRMQYYQILLENKSFYAEKRDFRDTNNINQELRQCISRFPDLNVRISNIKEHIRVNEIIKKKTQDSILYEGIKTVDSLVKAIGPQNVLLWEWSWFRNSAIEDFVGINLTVFNPYKKKVKYIDVTLQAYNPVGDLVKDHRTGLYEKTIRGIGPLEYFDKAEFNFENVYYSNVIETIKLRTIKYTFFDGSILKVHNPKQVIKE